MPNAFITGVAEQRLSEDERAFLRESKPAGLILFARNCGTPGQLAALVADFKECIGEEQLLILVDQEGGRVQRLKPPLARTLPNAATFGTLHAEAERDACRAAFLVSRLLADDLGRFGINTNCAPVLDVRFPGTHAVIGDRAFADDPQSIIALGRAVADGLLAGGILPVMKHMPGHGRATADSHFGLPVVSASRSELARTDFATFQALADLPAAMTAHVVFSAIDADAPASTSRIVTQQVMRELMDFDGLLVSDDLSMHALDGSIRSRAEAVIRAGSDIALHCNGSLREMREVAEGVPVLAERALERFVRAIAATRSREAFDVAEAEIALGRVLARAA